MTEDEAKTKWCPFVRAVACQDQMWANRPLTGPDDDGVFADEKTRCISSACMAWRWKYVQTNEDRGSSMASWPPVKAIYERSEHGYCGLAGSSQ